MCACISVCVCACMSVCMYACIRVHACMPCLPQREGGREVDKEFEIQ